MKRRELIMLLGGGAATWPLAARAQQRSMPVIGWLSAISRTGSGIASDLVPARPERERIAPGRNVAIEYRWANGQYDRLPAFAADLVNRPVDVILAQAPPGGIGRQGRDHDHSHCLRRGHRCGRERSRRQL